MPQPATPHDGCQQLFADQLHRVTDWPNKVTDLPHQARQEHLTYLTLVTHHNSPTCQMVYSLVPSRQSSGFPAPPRINNSPCCTSSPMASTYIPFTPKYTSSDCSYLVSDEEHLKNGDLQGMRKPSLQTRHPQRETDRVSQGTNQRDNGFILQY